MASNLPNSWNLPNIFIAGIAYGLYLTLSSWVLFYVATHTSFFKNSIHMHDLRFAPRSYLENFCLTTEIPRGAPVRLRWITGHEQCMMFNALLLVLTPPTCWCRD